MADGLNYQTPPLSSLSVMYTVDPRYHFDFVLSKKRKKLYSIYKYNLKHISYMEMHPFTIICPTRLILHVSGQNILGCAQTKGSSIMNCRMSQYTGWETVLRKCQGKHSLHVKAIIPIAAPKNTLDRDWPRPYRIIRKILKEKYFHGDFLLWYVIARWYWLQASCTIEGFKTWSQNRHKNLTALKI